MDFSSAQIQSLKTELEGPIAVWNANPTVRFGAVLVAMNFVWSLLTPTEPTSLAMSAGNTLFGGLAALGFATLCTELVQQADWGADDEVIQFRWLPRMQFETRVFGSRLSSSPPQRPTGYGSPRAMATGSMAKRLVIGFIWMIPLMWALPKVWWAMTAHWGISFTTEPTLLLLVGVGVAVLVVHEAIHALVAVLYRCGVSVGIVLPVAAYIRPSGAFLSRRARILSKLAPTIVITLGAGLILFYADGLLVTAALWALLLNTFGAVDDLRGAWQLLKVPSKRLWYAFPDRDRPTLAYDHLSQRYSMTVLGRCEELVKRLTIPLKIDQESTTRNFR